MSYVVHHLCRSGHKSAMVATLQNHSGILEQYFRSQRGFTATHIVHVVQQGEVTNVLCYPAWWRKAFQTIRFQVRIQPLISFWITLNYPLALPALSRCITYIRTELV